MRPKPAVEIKGSALPVLRVVVRDCHPQSLGEEMTAVVASAGPLLAEALAVLDLRERTVEDTKPGEIVAAARSAGVRLAAVLVGEGGMRANLADADLPVIESPVIGERPASEPIEAPGTSEAEQPESAAATGLGPPAPLCVTQPVRSGQRVYAQGRDLLVLAPTSRGAELMADGSIYAFGLLRGRALAGASGDRGARIVATRLDAELVAVAGVYRTLEAADIAGLRDGAASVALAFDEEGSERLVLRPVDHFLPRAS
jgi:septum site-determining protein MinC